MLRAAWLVGTLLVSSSALFAEPAQTRIVCRGNIHLAQREDLTKKLKRITGWSDLRFDRDGMLRLGTKEPVGGSPTARALLEQSAFGSNFIVLEDASKRSEVVFSRVIAGKWKYESSNSPSAFVVQIDFADFAHVMGDERAREAFDAGWGLLHELDHIVNESLDATSLGEAGECEDHINQMRRECNLPERASYFFTLLPLTSDPVFMTRLVRLAFEQEQTTPNKKKRYWLVWDANLVGGLDEQKQIASLR